MKAFTKSPTGGSRRDKPLLSDREKEIVQLIATGFRNKEIGENLFISEQTVKNHLHNIFDKLGDFRPIGACPLRHSPQPDRT